MRSVVLTQLEAPHLPCSEWSDLAVRLAMPGSPVPAAPSWTTGELWTSLDEMHRLTRLQETPAPDGPTGTTPERAAAWDAAERAVRAVGGTVRSFELRPLSPAARTVDHDSAYLYLVQLQPAPADEVEFNRWYDDEHLPGLAAADGVRAAHRLVRVDEGDGLLKYLAAYYLDCPSIRLRPDWRAAADTPWTARMHALPRKKATAMLRRLPGTHGPVPRPATPKEEA